MVNQKRKKAKKDVFTVNLYYDGLFTSCPMIYFQGQCRVLTDTNFDEMTFVHLLEILKRYVNENGFQIDMYLDLFGDVIMEIDSNVDFHTEGDDSVVIKNITTQDPFLTKLCSARILFKGNVEYGIYFKEIIEDPFMPLRKMRDDIRQKFMIDVSVKQCKRAKQLALFDHEGGLIEHYAKLYQYRQALLDSNPGSTCTLDVFESDNGSVSFKRMYTNFKGVKDAMGRDANNQMYPIAWAVVRVENADNWGWFLHLLHDDLYLNDGTSITIISDSHKGLIDAVNDWLPEAEHKKCTRHIYANFKKKFSGLQYQRLFWAAASYRRCAAFENGISESFNRAIFGEWIVYPSGFQELEVRKGDQSYGVSLQHKEEMDLETAQTTTTTKFPILKHDEYDMWRLRIEQYFQVQDYALWDVIENGNSFKPVAQTTTNIDGTSTSLIPGPVTTKEKVQNKNDVKAKSMLLMALPNEHLMTFNQYKDAKTLFAAMQTRFSGNEATKKTQKTLLNQMYENFSAPSTIRITFFLMITPRN
ncbi:ribonuclease H-like domain-containing protein [Tanacetum coccineum]